jgi:hypothetical protein
MTGEQVIAKLKDELADYGLSHLLDGVDPNRAETLPIVLYHSRHKCVVCRLSLVSTGRIEIPLGRGNYSYICSDRDLCRKHVLEAQAKKNNEAGYKLNKLAACVNLAKINKD